MKQGSLFCFILFCYTEISQTTTLHATLLYLEKALMSRGAPTWFEIVWIYNVQAIDY
jgi:hypothetical protein